MKSCPTVTCQGQTWMTPESRTADEGGQHQQTTPGLKHGGPWTKRTSMPSTAQATPADSHMTAGGGIPSPAVTAWSGMSPRSRARLSGTMKSHLTFPELARFRRQVKGTTNITMLAPD